MAGILYLGADTHRQLNDIRLAAPKRWRRLTYRGGGHAREP